MNFYEKFKELAGSEGLSPNGLAKELGISSGSVTAWKKGTEPGVVAVKKVAERFGVTSDYLLGRSEEKWRRLSVPKELSGVQIAFNRGEFEGLTQDEVERLAEFARFIKKERDEKG